MDIKSDTHVVSDFNHGVCPKLERTQVFLTNYKTFPFCLILIFLIKY